MVYLLGLGAPLIVALVTAINATPAQAMTCYEGLAGAVTCVTEDGSLLNGQSDGETTTFDSEEF